MHSSVRCPNHENDDDHGHENGDDDNNVHQNCDSDGDNDDDDDDDDGSEQQGNADRVLTPNMNDPSAPFGIPLDKWGCHRDDCNDGKDRHEWTAYELGNCRAIVIKHYLRLNL